MKLIVNVDAKRTTTTEVADENSVMWAVEEADQDEFVQHVYTACPQGQMFGTYRVGTGEITLTGRKNVMRYCDAPIMHV